MSIAALAERVNAAPHADQERAAPQKYELLDSVLLMFSNKQNLSNAMSAAEMTDKLGLHGLCQQWFVLVYRATTSDRLYGDGRPQPCNRASISVKGTRTFIAWCHEVRTFPPL
uniref:Uncharacterized protein n=1 Tax=Hyaloperonospora arabidopsidis (strain Emoy2) TaxID=559515 RepID=M4BQU8_HYAAE